MEDGPPAGRRTTRRHFLAAGVAGAAGMAALTGCLGHGEASDLDGSIVIDGSNTVLPHSAAIAEEFMWRNNQVTISVRGSGTGAGFQRFCSDVIDLQNASRQITTEETDSCANENVEYLEVTALRDGIAIIVHPDNVWCDDLTVPELRRIWEAGSDVETWADVRPEADWPDEEIELYGRDPASGTFDSYTERLMGEKGNIRNDYSASADSNVIVRGVRGSRHSLGWAGAGFFYENQDDLKLVGVDDPDGPVDGPVKPTTESIETGTYSPLSRWMYVYVNTNRLDREEVRAFARFYFQQIDDETHQSAIEGNIAAPDEHLTWTQWAARRVGFYAADDETVETSREDLEAAIEGRGR